MAQKTVLIIEDNDLNSKLMRAILRRGNYSSLEAGDATTGIRLAQEHKPDLILMDMGLPDIDGIAATRRLKSDPELSGIPVVVVTGYNVSEMEERARDAGVCGFLSKPVDIKTLMATIASFIQ